MEQHDSTFPAQTEYLVLYLSASVWEAIMRIWNCHIPSLGSYTNLGSSTCNAGALWRAHSPPVTVSRDQIASASPQHSWAPSVCFPDPNNVWKCQSLWPFFARELGGQPPARLNHTGQDGAKVWLSVRWLHIFIVAKNYKKQRRVGIVSCKIFVCVYKCSPKSLAFFCSVAFGSVADITVADIILNSLLWKQLATEYLLFLW